MAPKGVVGHAPSLTDPSQDGNEWVNVTWMPHTALSQKSHVCLSIRSAYTIIHEGWELGRIDSTLPEWRIRVSAHGIAGLPLIPLTLQTTSSPVRSKRATGSAVDVAVATDDPSSATRRPMAVDNATHECVWDYFLRIPIRWRDLPRDAYLRLEVLETAQTVVYQTVLPLFNRYGRLVTGLQKLPLDMVTFSTHVNHGLVGTATTTTDTYTKALHDVIKDDDHPVYRAAWTLHQLDKMAERRARATASTTQSTIAAAVVSATSEAVTFGQIPSVPWLDAMTKERATNIVQDALMEKTDPLLSLINHSSCASLIVELPEFDIPILYEETFYPMKQNGVCGAVSPVDWAAYRKKICEQSNSYGGGSINAFDPLQLVFFLDYANESDNPVEDKYRTLAHDLLRGVVDPALKPDREQRYRLASIIDSPSHHPTHEEKDLLWRFRFSLVDNRRALTKFLLAVDWTVESEVVQAAELLEQWRMRSPIEVTDALKLLGKHVAFSTNLVRDYAIETLALAPDSELRLYLLQLVQALKYESIPRLESTASRVSSPTNISSTSRLSSLAKFLIQRAAGNIQLANYLYWYLKVELEYPSYGELYREVFAALEATLSSTSCSLHGLTERTKTSSADSTVTPFKSIVDSVSKLGSSLRKFEHPAVASLSDRDKPATKRQPKERSMWEVLVEQDSFISGVLDIQQRCREVRGKKDAKEAELRSLLSKEGYHRKQSRDVVPLPSRPDIFVNGVVPESAIMFKSALYPALLEFNVDGKLSSAIKASVNEQPLTSYKVMIKTGDDLRQDQLIIMMIQLMDGLLKRGALDLCLTPYSVIATSPTSGLVEFVDRSMPISAILSKFNGSILQYFQTTTPQIGAKYGVRPDVMSAYVRSCAGYCVITYLLGVGDRHLDNIMLRSSGHFFHIDFGFIFGRDPKPLPPLFRLTREMVDGMGGADSSEYRQFCSLACQAFNALRKSAGLILNLLSLMSDAGIEDLSNNASADAGGVLAKVEERFRLDMTDEQAERFFIGLVNDCLAAIAPRVMDVFHSIAVARR